MLYTLPYIGYEKGWQGRQPRQKYPLVSFRAKRRISSTSTSSCAMLPRSFVAKAPLDDNELGLQEEKNSVEPSVLCGKKS